MVLFADFTDEPSCFGGNFASIFIAQQLVFNIRSFHLADMHLKQIK